MLEFQPFPKAPRLEKVHMLVTEKIDGTNACVVIDDDGNVSAQSRNRIIVPDDDNFGFAAWVAKHADQLRQLGTGYHFGEWWGQGIQRGYGLQERRFSLFNAARWTYSELLPECCHVVPVVYAGLFDPNMVLELQDELATVGSYAAPGFRNPEGLMVWLNALHKYIKAPLDPRPKGAIDV